MIINRICPGKMLKINGVLEDCLAVSGTVPKNTFVELVNGKVRASIDHIDGITKTTCTATTGGRVYFPNIGG